MDIFARAVRPCAPILNRIKDKEGGQTDFEGYTFEIAVFFQIFPLWNCKLKCNHELKTGPDSCVSCMHIFVVDVKFHHIFITSCCCSSTLCTVLLYLSLF